MKALTRYLTQDSIEHKTRESAESHCLDKATLRLTECLRRAGIENPHAIASKIVLEALPEKGQADMGQAYYELFETVSWIKDGCKVFKD